MNVAEAIHARHSVRFFTSEPIDRDVLVELMSAAAAAPSPWNSQPWRFYVATGATRDKVTQAMALSTRHLAEYMDVLGEDGVAHAERFYANLGDAAAVVGVSVPVVEGETEQIDEYIAAGCAIQNILLTTVEKGLGACSITIPDFVMDEVRAAYGVPEDRILVCLVVVGHPGEEPTAPDHREDVYTFLE